jgi:hypothetical protein
LLTYIISIHECQPIIQGLSALLVGLDKRENDEIPKNLLAHEGLLEPHAGDIDALFLTSTKNQA